MRGETILDSIHGDRQHQVTHIGGKTVLDNIHGDNTVSSHSLRQNSIRQCIQEAKQY